MRQVDNVNQSEGEVRGIARMELANNHVLRLRHCIYIVSS
jgi:hypothetical protein